MKTIYLILFLLLVSCSSDDKKELFVNSEKENTSLTLDEAKIGLIDFLNDQSETKSQTNIEITNHNIVYYETANIQTETAISTFFSKHESIPVFEFATKINGKQGYAIVVGDQRIKKVLASVEFGSLSDTSFIEPLKMFYKSIPAFIDEDINAYYSSEKRMTDVTTKVSSVSTLYCFLPTMWSQYFPYNAKLPTVVATTKN